MRKLNLVGGLLILSLGCTGVQADPCAKDRALTCNDVTPGDSRVFDCLIGRQDRIEPACAQAVARADQLATTVLAACKPEAEKWCAQYANNGRAAVVDCLKAKKDKVGEPCKRAYRQFKSYNFDIRS